MSEGSSLIDVDTFTDAVFDGTVTKLVNQVQVPGFAQPLPTLVLQRGRAGTEGCPLVICFHGAIDQSKRRTPAFDGRFLLLNGLSSDTTVVSIADPSLTLHRELKAAWYAGNEVADTPQAVRGLVGQMAQKLRSSRIVFVGGSTGAHAALVQSFHCPNSIVVVENPILHISNYNPRHIAEYRKFCWPKLARTAPFPAAVNDNVAKLYAHGSENTVVLLNNSRDPHLWLHTAEFLHTIRGCSTRSRLLLYSDFFPEFPGHSFPAAVWARWARAACEAVGLSVNDIGARMYELLQLTAPNSPRDSTEFSRSDLEIAQRIYRETAEAGAKA
jgi:hypothetical protein